MVFQSEEEALEALARTRSRLIATGYEVGVEIAELYGGVHAQMIFSEMEERGLLSQADKEIPANWLANIFKGKNYKGTWTPLGHVKIGNTERNVHAAPRMMWGLKSSTPVDDAEPLTRAEVVLVLRDLRMFYTVAKKSKTKLSPEFVKLGKWLRSLVDKEV
jgi:hypothetical protein